MSTHRGFYFVNQYYIILLGGGTGMDLVKIGKFISEMRKNQGLTLHGLIQFINVYPWKKESLFLVIPILMKIGIVQI